MSHGGSEPAGLHGLRKQVTEVKEGPLELRRKREARETHLGERYRRAPYRDLHTWERRGWGKTRVREREKETETIRLLRVGGFRGSPREGSQ